VRAGPKAAPSGRPLHLQSLPPAGGERVIAFIERYCRLPKGGKGNPAEQPIRLRDWQKAIIRGLYDRDPRPRQGLVSVARKNGKSLLAACLGLYHLLADGERSAEVIIVSVDERTAKVIFNLCRRMVELDRRLSGVLQVYADRLYHPASDSVLEALPGEWSRLQGRNPSCSICDEVHVMDPDTWDALALAGGTRTRPLTLGISTECDDDERNLMARLVEHGRARQDPDFFFVEFTAPEGCDVRDRAAWAAANPMLGDTLDPEHLAAMVRTTREAKFRRFHLNQRVRLEGAWLPASAWEGCADPRPMPDGAEVTIGFDGSYSGDATAIVAVELGPVPHLDVVRLWEPAPEARSGDPVPIVAVEDALREACRRWKVRALVADPYRWARSLEILGDEGLPVEVFPQSPARMTPATTRFAEAVLNQALTHSGNPDLARHVTNAVIKADSRGTRIIKEHKHSTRRIDLAVAAVMALDTAATLEPALQPEVFLL
jgi:phage terminase large subunit-like protein